MTNIPDWQDIANNLIANAIWASPFVGWYVWKNRKKIAAKVRGSVTVELPAQTIHAGFPPPQVRSFPPTLRTVGSSIDLRWNVEAPTPSLAKRLADEGLELVSWYLRLS